MLASIKLRCTFIFLVLCASSFLSCEDEEEFDEPVPVTTSSEGQFDTSDTPTSEDNILEITSSDLYWGKYFNVSNDEPCDPAAASSLADCYHSGERIVATAEGLTSCENVLVSDSYNIFDWTCDESSGGVIIKSQGLRDGSSIFGLIDSIQDETWKELTVYLETLESTYSASKKNLWKNEIIENPSALDQELAVYVFTESTSRDSMDVQASNIIITSDSAYTLTHITGSQNCGANSCFLNVSNFDFVWIENLRVNSLLVSDHSIFFDQTHFSTLRNIRANDAMGSTFKYQDSKYLRTNGIISSDSQSLGFEATNISHSIFSRVNVYSHYASSGGFSLASGSDYNKAIDIIIANANTNSFVLEGDHNSFLMISASNGNGDGLSIDGNNNTFSHTSVYGHNGRGIHVSGGSGNFFQNTSVYSTIGNAFETQGSNHYTGVLNSSMSNIGGEFIVGNSSNDLHIIDFNGSESNGRIEVAGGNLDLSGTVQIPTNDRCIVSSGTADYATGDCSSATDSSIVLGLNSSQAFTGKIGSESPYSSTPFWFTADVAQIVYGLFDEDSDGGEATYNTDTAARGRCESGDKCVQWAFTLNPDDSSNGGTGTIFNTHPCPNGDETLTRYYADGSSQQILRYASEFISDGVGNDDGLCESNETCYLQPHFGHHYYGHTWAYASTDAPETKTCSKITDGGTIENVVLLKLINP